jgi:serine/threonine protein kinase
LIAMQLVRGERLRDVLARGRLPAARAVDVALEVAEGLASARDRGIVHRDLTPNVTVGEDGHARIIDFGLAKLVEPLSEQPGEAETERGTATGLLMGTTGYMSPEQARGKPADHRSDVFTLGIVLHEMLAGESPFQRASALETLTAIINDTEPPVNLPLDAGASSELQRIVRKCLAKDPRDRYQTTKDLVVDLRDVRRRIESGPVVPVAATRPTARGRRWTMWALAATVVAVLGGNAAYRQSGPPAAEGGTRQSIAVLVFQNLGAPEDAYLEAFMAGLTQHWERLRAEAR